MNYTHYSGRGSHLVTFHAHALNQIGKQVGSARTLKVLKLSLWRALELRIQAPTLVATLQNTNANFFSCFTLHVPGDTVSNARGHGDLGIGPSTRAEHGLNPTQQFVSSGLAFP